MAISKVVYKSSANATPVTWMDATPATALAADIMAPKTAMLADGVLTTGTGSGGGGGLEFEEGTWTPTADIAGEHINFSNTHSTLPIYVVIYNTTNASAANYNSMMALCVFDDGIISDQNSTSRNYIRVVTYYGASNGGLTTGGLNVNNKTGEASSSQVGYWVKTTEFYAYSNSNSRYWKAGNTYKWIAIWAPTT